MNYGYRHSECKKRVNDIDKITNFASADVENWIIIGNRFVNIPCVMSVAGLNL